MGDGFKLLGLIVDSLDGFSGFGNALDFVTWQLGRGLVGSLRIGIRLAQGNKLQIAEDGVPAVVLELWWYCCIPKPLYHKPALDPNMLFGCFRLRPQGFQSKVVGFPGPGNWIIVWGLGFRGLELRGHQSFSGTWTLAKGVVILRHALGTYSTAFSARMQPCRQFWCHFKPPKPYTRNPKLKHTKLDEELEHWNRIALRHLQV